MEGISQNKQLTFYLYLSFCIGVFITFSSYFHLPLAYAQDYFVYGVHFMVLQFTVFGYVYFLTLNKYIFYSVFPIVFMSMALFSYWVYTLDVNISESVIQAAFESNIDIAIDLLTIPFLMYVFVVFLILISIIRLYNKSNISGFNWRFFIIAVLAIGTYYFVENVRFGTFKRRMPYSFVSEFRKYLDKPVVSLSRFNNVELSSENDVDIVFVLGESVRADHIGVNGYNRNTTPRLIKRKNIISFPNINTPLTYTAASVPQILTNISIDDRNFDKEIFSIYSFLNEVNKNTIWIGNQTPEKSYKEYINQNKEIKLIDPFHSVLSFHKKHDGELLEIFENCYAKNSNSFYTIHMIGSHWWYEDRYPKEFQEFVPVIKSKHIASNSNEEMINSYDNTIVYLDYFLDRLISVINKTNKKTILIYLSDHGEVLGENGRWLHAQKDEASMNPAMLIWYSDQFEKTFPKKIENANNNKLKSMSTDLLFSTILDVIDLKGYDYLKNNSLFYGVSGSKK